MNSVVGGSLQSVPGHRGEELNSLNSSYSKAILCQKWAEDARDLWYTMRRNFVEQGRGPATRWGKEFDAQDLAGAEQMYSRWAQVYFMQAMCETILSAARGD